jgi:hypothetical protein
LKAPKKEFIWFKTMIMDLQQAKEILLAFNEDNGDTFLREAIQLAVKKLSPDSTAIIGKVHERYEELGNYDFNWKSFYNGWIEGRTDFCYGYIREQQKLEE